MLMRVVCGSVLMYLNNQLQIMLDGASGGVEGGGGGLVVDSYGLVRLTCVCTEFRYLCIGLKFAH